MEANADFPPAAGMTGNWMGCTASSAVCAASPTVPEILFQALLMVSLLRSYFVFITTGWRAP